MLRILVSTDNHLVRCARCASANLLTPLTTTLCSSKAAKVMVRAEMKWAVSSSGQGTVLFHLLMTLVLV